MNPRSSHVVAAHNILPLTRLSALVIAADRLDAVPQRCPPLTSVRKAVVSARRTTALNHQVLTGIAVCRSNPNQHGKQGYDLR